jgi:hypothetical protein
MHTLKHTGRVALTVGKDKTLRMWDLTTGRLALTQTVGEGKYLHTQTYTHTHTHT